MVTEHINWNGLVAERKAWVEHNFPDQGNTPEQSIMGCIEESGELAHATLKEIQRIRNNEDLVASAQDAIGDISVFLLGVMQWRNHTPRVWRPVYVPRDLEHAVLLIGHRVGDLAGHYIDGIHFHHRLDGDIDRLVEGLHRYCFMRDWNYQAIVLDTWAQVRQRDWIAYPENGLTA